MSHLRIQPSYFYVRMLSRSAVRGAKWVENQGYSAVRAETVHGLDQF